MLFCISRIIPDRMFFSALSFEKDVLIANGSKSSLFRECKQAKGQIFFKKMCPKKCIYVVQNKFGLPTMPLIY